MLFICYILSSPIKMRLNPLAELISQRLAALESRMLAAMILDCPLQKAISARVGRNHDFMLIIQEYQRIKVTCLGVYATLLILNKW